MKKTDESKQTNNTDPNYIDESSIPFTARLMAYYRAQEQKKDKPLLIDPYAQRLAGDLSSFFKKERHAASSNDYSIIRSHYIDTKLLRPWCNQTTTSQIVLLGAGLDTRAYRLEFLSHNNHTLFEVDFPTINHYKQQLLPDKALCALKRISADLNSKEWSEILLNQGFSTRIPTFWIAEGLVYYLDKPAALALFKTIHSISPTRSQLFVDVCIPILAEVRFGSFLNHFQWGIDFEAVPHFFASLGWHVDYSYADDHDHGRNVGQRGLIFVHGIKTNITQPDDREAAKYEDRKLDRELTDKGLQDQVKRIIPFCTSSIRNIITMLNQDTTPALEMYFSFIGEIKPHLENIVATFEHPLVIGHISPRLRRNPLLMKSQIENMSKEEKIAHMGGYLEAILKLLYYSIKKIHEEVNSPNELLTDFKDSKDLSRMKRITTLLYLVEKRNEDLEKSNKKNEKNSATY